MPYTIEDLPTHLQASARRQLAGQRAGGQGAGGQGAARGAVPANPKKAPAPAAQSAKPAARTSKAAPAPKPAPAPKSAPDGEPLFATAGAHQGRSRSRHLPGRMNGIEAKYAEVLKERMRVGEIVWWAFESVTFRLGADCRYTPDFLIQMADGSLEIAETKGYFRDDARVKVSVMKEKYPFPIWLIYWDKANKATGTAAEWRIIAA